MSRLLSVIHRLGRLYAAFVDRTPRPVRWLLVRVRPIQVSLLLATVATIVVLTILLPPVYYQYSYQPDANAATWRSLDVQYASSSGCRSCHGTEYQRWTGQAHAGLDCETCHGPLAAHAAAADPAATKVLEPAGGICLGCHQATQGRPAAVAQIVASAHYPGASCTQCHDPHTAVAVKPASITHPLAGLPACTVCHGPGALRPMPTGHAPVADAVCLTCHRPETAQVTRP